MGIKSSDDKNLYHEFFDRNDKVLLKDISIDSFYWKKILDLWGEKSRTKEDLNWSLSCLIQNFLIRTPSVEIFKNIKPSKSNFVIDEVEISRLLLDKVKEKLNIKEDVDVIDKAISYYVTEWEIANGEIFNYDVLQHLS